ncbi:Peptidase family S41 [Treponema sp. JC4]|uniref:S41 family peptidase n=1 Tax=Treponema sp. JC4 TaxID=1124982 RepID=UPI00025B0A7C|nr:S41 family peptidase [Treponema sp. JC4]EID85270.1 Peptidase family S41 [Treponema sp. JC4]
MSRRIIKTVIQLLLLSSAFFSCRNLEDDATYKDEVKSVSEDVQAESLTLRPTPIYEYSNGKTTCLANDFPLFFTPGGDLPYVEIQSFTEAIFDDTYTITREGTLYKITQSWNQNCYFTIDFSDGNITYSDFDYFICPPDAAASCDVIFDSSLIKRETIVDIRGEKVSYSINLTDYNIPHKYENNYGFLPMNTLKHLLYWGGSITYNDKEAFFDYGAEWQIPEYSAKMSNPKESYSQEMADYSYNHLCFVLDLGYGRKNYLGVSSFDSWIRAAGLKEALTSTNIDTAENALAKLLLQDIADLHTYYQHWTPFKGLNPNEDTGRGTPAGCLYWMPPDFLEGPSKTRRINYQKTLLEKFKEEKSSSYYESEADKIKTEMHIFIPKDQSADADYKATKNTLFMFFRSFGSQASYAVNYKPKWRFYSDVDDIASKGKDDGIIFYKSENGSGNLTPADDISKMSDFISKVKNERDHGYGISLKNTNDDIQLMLISNYIIRKLKEDSTRPMENVVLDFSLNNGGANDDETIFASWFLGESIVCYKNTATGSKCAVKYTADINFDGKIDDSDTIKDLQRYCITSFNCFSCGNLLPAQIYFNDSVKTFGEKTGGGTCPIMGVGMPSGTRFSTSCQIQLSTLINGSFVDIDAGIDVDVPIFVGEFDKVYNRNTFCKEYLK